MKFTLAHLTATQREALIDSRARGLHRGPGGFRAHADAEKMHSTRAVMAIQRLGLIRFQNDDTTQPGTITVAGTTLLDGGSIDVDQEDAA